MLYDTGRILHSLSGTMAICETPLIDAVQMAVDEINEGGGILGRRIIPVLKDCASRPETFYKNTLSMIEDEGISTFFGCWTSSSRKSVKTVLEQSGAMLWYPVQYEGLESSDNIIYTGSCLNQQIFPAIEWLVKNRKKRVFLIGSDYVYPHTAHAVIKSHLAATGDVRVVREIYIPLGEQDFSSLKEAVEESRPDMILNTINGDSNIFFFREYNRAGFAAETLPVMSFSVAEEELKHIGVDMSGHMACWSYFQSLPSQKNRDFVSRFRTR